MKRRMYAKVLAAAMAVSLVATGVAGCGNEKKEEPKAKTEANLEITEEDPNEEAVEKLKAYIPKVDKIDVVENAKNLDMDKAVSSLVTPEKAGEVEKVTVEDTKLDPKKTGTYEVTVTVALKEAANQAGAGVDTENTAEAAAETKEKAPAAAANEQADPASDDQKAETDQKADADQKTDADQKADTDQEAATDQKTEDGQKEDPDTDTGKADADSGKDQEITGTVEVDVITKEEAEGNANKGDAVITDDNVILGQEPAEEETEEKKADEEGQQASADTDKKDPAKDTGSKDNSSSSKPSSNSGSSNKGNSGGNKGSSSSSSKPSKPAHKHTWKEVGHNETVYKTVTDYETVPVYGEKVVCGCGKQFNNTSEWDQHSIDGCPYGYSVKEVQTGTKKVAVGSHKEAVGKKWVSEGYRCSGCGARK